MTRAHSPKRAWSTLLLALALIGCDASVTALESIDAGSPQADAAPDSPVVEAGPDALGQCREADQRCTAGSDCCSGLCDIDPAGKVTCRPATGCLALGQSCSYAGACCALGCTGPSETKCGEPVCASIGTACQVDAECCTHHCLTGKCAPGAVACSPAGESCIGEADCCSHVCKDIADGTRRCALLQACRVEGEVCSDDSACCSSKCTLGPNALGTCAPLAQCTSGDGKPCKRQVGEVCKDDAECCSRSCLESEGTKRCVSVGGCRARCEACISDDQCCSGSCATGADGARRCAAAGTCLPPGDICATDDQCCAGTVKAKCYEDPPLVGARRCHDPASSCSQDGDPCVLASACCSGIGARCSPTESGFACRPTCVPDGEGCTLRSDCCETFSDCLVLGGNRVCAPLVH
jgi:hypothetical protein